MGTLPQPRTLPLLLFLFVIARLGLSYAADYKVFCTAKEMTVTVNFTDSKVQLYLDRLKGYPDCEPQLGEGRATFHLSLLEDFYACGTTRVSDLTGRKVFYNRIVIEYTKNKKEKILAKCEVHGRNLLDSSGLRRQVRQSNSLPPGFLEPEDLNITDSIISHAMLPDLNVGVRQNGLYVDTQMNVQPGTPLEMEVFLDQNSSSTYGLLVNYMNVTDKSPGQKEIIIYKGCSIDPYLFSNFETEDGNKLTATFRAFKFPESSYVLFIGTVNICIRFCQGVPCSNGQQGFGRRRRDLASPNMERDPNQLFEVTITSILKVDPNGTESTNKGSIGGTIEDSGKNIILPNDDDNSINQARSESGPLLENGVQRTEATARIIIVAIVTALLTLSQ